MTRYASELSDFADLLTAAAQWKNLPPGIVEKDYYLVRALHALQRELKGQFVLKGGTSLSKGWNLLERFSEDIDLLLRLDSGGNPISGGERDRRLKGAIQALAKTEGFQLVAELPADRGVHRGARFKYPRVVHQLEGLSEIIELEAGTRGSASHTTVRAIKSVVADFVTEKGYSVQVEDLSPFEMDLLDVKQTFVEKLFVVHATYVENRSLKKARHYYDLFRLCQMPDVKEFAGGNQYYKMIADTRVVSDEHFPKTPLPETQSFASSPALSPIGKDREELERNYEREKHLFFTKPPTLGEILDAIGQILPRL